MIRIPYGISHFASLHREGYHFVDKTPFIEKLERAGEKNIFFLRPRRFGKSLWISILEHYYGIEHKHAFGELFGSYYIGQHPTPLAGSYLTLVFDFSRIDTTTPEATYEGFLNNVRYGAEAMMLRYPHLFSETNRQDLWKISSPDEVVKYLMNLVGPTGQSIYLLIDEYDHFANELVAFRLEDFKATVSRNGFVRKFYEALKTATRDGAISRMFITGVSPLTLDSLTSGFNIAKNLSLNPVFHDMMGFRQEETEVILRRIGIEGVPLSGAMEDMRRWYNGYLFTKESAPSLSVQRLYNPDMVLYFASEYLHTGHYPEDLLDINIASDYGKIRQIFKIAGREEQNLEILDQLITQGSVSAELTRQFNFERNFERDDFVSLLFYMGMVTIGGINYGDIRFEAPNAVIRELYYDYFTQLIREIAGYPKQEVDIRERIYQLAWHNDPAPLVEMVSETLRQLSNRDWRGFDEKHLKAILVALLHAAKIYFIKSEYELAQKYVDILLLHRPPFDPPYLFAIELKYLSKDKEGQLSRVTQQAREQLTRYLATPEAQALPNLKAWVIVFVGTECRALEEIA